MTHAFDMTLYFVQVDSANKLETGDVKNRDCDSGDYNQPLSDVSSMVRIRALDKNVYH